MTTIVTTQAELNVALDADSPSIVIDSPAGVWLTLTKTGSSRVVARGSSSVEARGSSRVEAWESSSVVAWESSRVVARESSRVVARESSRVEAWESSRVEARESSRVEAWESSRVVARESSSVVAWESSSVVAWGSSRVVAWESSRVVARESSSVVARGSSRVEAGSYVAVHLHSANATVVGGVIIDLTKLDLTQPGDWLTYHGATVTKAGYATLYKAVLDDWTTGRGTQWTYRPGTTVTAADFAPTRECGQGLHLCVTPSLSRSYLMGATRFVAVKVKAADLIPLDDKAKVPSCKVLHEVDIDGVRVQS